MKIPEVKNGWMTDEQCGRILRLSDELGEFDKALSFINNVVLKHTAQEYILDLEKRISEIPQLCECGRELDPSIPEEMRTDTCSTCLGDMR